MKLTLIVEADTLADLRQQACGALGLAVATVEGPHAPSEKELVDKLQHPLPLDEAPPPPKKTRKPRVEPPVAPPPAAPEAAVAPTPAPAANSETITEKLRDAAQTYIDSGGTTAHLFGLVAQFGVKNVRSVSAERADEFLTKLAKLPKQDATS